MERFSSRGNEWMRLKICECARVVASMQRDFNTSENPWNGKRRSPLTWGPFWGRLLSSP